MGEPERRKSPVRLVIAGLPRCGTTLLATLLHQQPGVRFVTDYVQAHAHAAERLRVRHDQALDLAQRRVALALARDNWLRLRHVVLVGTGAFRTLDELHRAILGELAADAGVGVVGHKAVLEPGAVADLLAQTDVHVIVMLRDPRDAVLSHWHHQGTSAERYLAQWRAMARFALAERSPRFAWVRYEDLVRTPSEALARVLGWWGASAVAASELVFTRGAVGQDVAWVDNSSFGDVKRVLDSAPVERWRARAGSKLVRYAQVACAAEIERLGYPPGDVTIADRARFGFHRAYHTLDQRGVAATERARRWLTQRLAPPLDHHEEG